MYVTLNLLAILLQSYSIKDVCRFVNVASIKEQCIYMIELCNFVLIIERIIELDVKAIDRSRRCGTGLN